MLDEAGAGAGRCAAAGRWEETGAAPDLVAGAAAAGAGAAEIFGYGRFHAENSYSIEDTGDDCVADCIAVSGSAHALVAQNICEVSREECLLVSCSTHRPGAALNNSRATSGRE